MSEIEEKNTEQQILEAATELFIEKGFSATSTTEIAKKVGCNQAAVHYYYRTKEKLFAAIFENKFKYFFSRFFESSMEELPFEEKLAKKVEAHFDLIKNNRKLPRFILNEVISNPKRLKAMKVILGQLPKKMVNKFENDLKEAIKQGSIRDMSIYDLILTIISLNIAAFVVGPIFTSIVDLTDEEYEKLLETRKKEHVRIILASLKP